MYRVSLRSGLAAIAVLTFCQDLRASCSALPNPESDFKPKLLMTDGFDAKYGQFPWMVSIQLPISGPRHYCGGTIISARWILTAAHCLTELPRKFIIIFGEINQQLMNQRLLHGFRMITSEGAIHPNFNEIQATCDIGLLYTPKKIAFNDYIQPIRLAGMEERHKTYENMNGLVVGWGMQHDFMMATKYLKFGRQTIISDSECQSYKWEPRKGVLCTSGQTASVTCGGDSGGPLVVRDEDEYVQIGIVSASKVQECNNFLPHAFTRITVFTSWIKEVTGIEY